MAFLGFALGLSGSSAPATPPGAVSPGEELAEQDIKIAYLLNFARFVDWPANAFAGDTAALRIGIPGRGSLDPDVVREMEKRTIHGRPIRVVWLLDVEAAVRCHIVFVPQTTGAAKLGWILDATSELPVLTVSDAESFTARGGVIQFYTEDDMVRFEINPAAARRNQLRISSHLLSLARLTPDAESSP